ncbi:hypothetical protein AWENTII_002572 [Aspergillus wentii]
MKAVQEAGLSIHETGRCLKVGAEAFVGTEVEAEALAEAQVRTILLEARRSIVVEKLTKNVTEAHLREIFGGFGDIQNLDIPINRAFMTNRGTAYILYYDPADAEAAIAHMHEAQLDGAVLSVSIVLPRRAFSRSPPPARGGKGGFGRHRHSQRQTLDTRSSRPSPYSHRSPPSSKSLRVAPVHLPCNLNQDHHQEGGQTHAQIVLDVINAEVLAIAAMITAVQMVAAKAEAEALIVAAYQESEG